MDLQTIRKYVQNKAWAAGFASDLGGSLLMVSALASAPVSVIQPVSGGGLIVLSLLSHFFFAEKLQTGEWVAVVVTFLGIVGVGIATSGVDSGGSEDGSSAGVLRLVTVLSLFFAALIIGLRRAKAWTARAARQATPSGPSHPKKAVAASYSVFSGCFFALSSTTCRSGFVVGAATGQRLLFGVAGMACSVANTSVGFVYQTIALKEGSAVMISTITTVTTMMAGMVLGITALGEGLPSTASAMALHAASLSLIAVGSIVLGHGGWDVVLKAVEQARQIGKRYDIPK